LGNEGGVDHRCRHGERIVAKPGRQLHSKQARSKNWRSNWPASSGCSRASSACRRMIFIWLENILPHQVGFWRAAEDVFVSGYQQCGHVDRLSGRASNPARAMPRCLGNAFRRHLTHHAHAHPPDQGGYVCWFPQVIWGPCFQKTILLRAPRHRRRPANEGLQPGRIRGALVLNRARAATRARYRRQNSTAH